MRKVFILMMPLFCFLFLMAGCSIMNPQNEMNALLFDCETELFSLRLGTAEEAREIAFAPLLTSGKIEDCTIEYDENVIDYDPVTGKMIAQGVGKTKIKATSGSKTVSVEVVVDSAIYCSSLTSQTLYIELGSMANLDVSKFVNAGYNMGFNYYNLSPDILSINEVGIIEPKVAGEAQIKVEAKGAVNQESASGYDPMFAIMTIVVIEPRTSLNLSILDSNMQELEYYVDDYGMKTYYVYSRRGERVYYTMKLSSDQSLVNCYFAEKSNIVDCLNLETTSLNTRLFAIASAYKFLSDGAVYQSFYVQDYGTDYMVQEVVERGLNFYYQRQSERICLKVYYESEYIDLNCGVFLDKNYTEYSNTNNALQYLLFSESEVFVQVKISSYCDQRFEIKQENLVAVLEDDGWIRVTAGDMAGLGKLEIISKDSAKTKVIYEFYTNLEADTIVTSLVNGGVVCCEPLENLLVKFNYAVYDKSGTLQQNQGLKIVFFDELGEVIDLGEKFNRLYVVAGNPSSCILEFNAEGVYNLRLMSSDENFLSEKITITILRK